MTSAPAASRNRLEPEPEPAGRVQGVSARARPATGGLALAFGLPLAVYAWTGSYARYVADDYCWAGVLRTEGFLNAQVSWYVNYSPRYAFTFIVNLVELAGPAIVPALPLAAIVTWLVVLSWALAQLPLRLGRLASLVLAEIVALATFQTAPDLPQSLYWQTGVLTYSLPLILATLLGGWIARAARFDAGGVWRVLMSGAVTFVAGGLAEAYLIPQNVALTLIIIACLLWWRGQATRRALPHLMAAWAGGVLALIAIVVAPATASRVGGTPADLWLALSAAIATCAFQATRLVRYFLPTVLVCLAAPGVLASLAGRPVHGVRLRDFGLVTAIVAITLPFCYFPSFYAQNGNPPARSLIVPGCMFVGYLLYAGYAGAGRVRGRLLRMPRLVGVTAMVAVGVVPVGIAVTSWPAGLDAAQHAALWDAEDQQIRAQRASGAPAVVVPPLPAYLGEDFVTPDRTNWFNVCVARYYGIPSIAARQ